MPSTNAEPSEPPPSYIDATKTPPAAGSPSNTTNNTSHLQVPPKARNGIPPQDRRSMEDESRDLPSGWVRQYDSKSHHQFFVDTRASPPRSIWSHPYDDDTYLSTLPPSERERIKNLHPVPEDDFSSADEREHDLPPRQEKASDSKKIGQRIMDKLTHTTHAERVAARRRRSEEEAIAYQRHLHIRRQMSLAAETGQPQLLGTDSDGKEVYIEPPGGPGGGYYGEGGISYGGTGPGARGYGYNPYTQGPYSNPNAKFIRPSQPYGRPYPGYGYGYGGGFGYPLLGLGGGLLLGGLLF